MEMRGMGDIAYLPIHVAISIFTGGELVRGLGGVLDRGSITLYLFGSGRRRAVVAIVLDLTSFRHLGQRFVRSVSAMVLKEQNLKITAKLYMELRARRTR